MPFLLHDNQNSLDYQFFMEAWPYLLTRLIELSTDYGGMLMLANIDDEALAASSMITSIQLVLRSVNATFLYYTAIQAAEAKANNNLKRLPNILKASWIFAALISLLALPPTLYSKSLLTTLGQPEDVSELTQQYFRAYAVSIPLSLLGIGNQQLTLGLGKPKIVLAVTAASRALLLFAGYAFMYGKFGMLKLGAPGLGLAYSFSYILYFLSSTALFSSNYLYDNLNVLKGSLKEIKSALYINVIKGLPIGLYAFIELGSLLLATILIGLSGDVYLAAFQPALQYGLLLANTTFAISTSAGVMIKRKIATNQKKDAKKLAKKCFTINLLLPSLTLLTFAITKNLLAMPFLRNNRENGIDIYTTANTFLFINLLGQIFDGFRNAIAGIFRGLGDTHTAMISNIISALIIYLPITLLSTFTQSSSELDSLINPAIIIFARTLAIAASCLGLLFFYDKKISTLKTLDSSAEVPFDTTNVISALTDSNTQPAFQNSANKSLADNTPSSSGWNKCYSWISPSSWCGWWSGTSEEKQRLLPQGSHHLQYN